MGGGLPQCVALLPSPASTQLLPRLPADSKFRLYLSLTKKRYSLLTNAVWYSPNHLNALCVRAELDNCGDCPNENYTNALKSYQLMGEALNKTGRPIFYSESQRLLIPYAVGLSPLADSGPVACSV